MPSPSGCRPGPRAPSPGSVRSPASRPTPASARWTGGRRRRRRTRSALTVRTWRMASSRSWSTRELRRGRDRIGLERDAARRAVRRDRRRCSRRRSSMTASGSGTGRRRVLGVEGDGRTSPRARRCPRSRARGRAGGSRRRRRPHHCAPPGGRRAAAPRGAGCRCRPAGASRGADRRVAEQRRRFRPARSRRRSARSCARGGRSGSRSPCCGAWSSVGLPSCRRCSDPVGTGSPAAIHVERAGRKGATLWP